VDGPQRDEDRRVPDIAGAVAALAAGGLVAFPTETVYGLGADCFDETAVRRVYELKGRPANNPLIVHVTGEAMARRVAKEWPEGARRLARAFWPGPVTIVVPAAESLPRAVTANGPTVAVRCPDHPVALALLIAFGGPLVGPSANRSGRVSPTCAEHVRAEFGDAVPVLEGGACTAGLESVVVVPRGVMGQGPARVLRPGVIGAEELASVMGEEVVEANVNAVTETGGAEGGAVASPGLLGPHYAPRKPARLFSGAGELRAALAAMRDEGRGAIVLAHGRVEVEPPHRLVMMPAGAHAYAAALYAALRRADDLEGEVILVERPPAGGGVWRAVADRLARATAARREA